MNKTPIVDFVSKYSKQNIVRAHMPGHKGKGVLGVEKYDITEVFGADDLYSADGIIKVSQENISKLFNTAKTLYSTEGSSLSIRAMLSLVKMYAEDNGLNAKIVAARNVHKTFVTAAGILGLDIDFIYSGSNLFDSVLTADAFNQYLSSKEKPTALYVTSPDYLGNITDIKSLATICKMNDILLLVDNAHGAYLNFLEKNIHPIALGADICCDSAHKTLPVITGGGYLHISKKAPKFIKDNAMNAMSLFASTSPSYLILASLDAANKYLETYKAKLSNFIKSVDLVKFKLKENGYVLIGDEPLKITVNAKIYGYKGTELAEIFSKSGIMVEFYDDDYLCLMLTPSNSGCDLSKILKTFLKIERKEPIKPTAPMLKPNRKACSIGKALFGKSEVLPVMKSLGRVFADSSISCPPAIPVIISGEVIDENAIELMKYYGIKKCKVLK